MAYSLSIFRKKLLFEIKKGITMDNIKSFATDADYQGNIDYDVFLPTKGFNLQRDFVWTLDQKRAFILSVLKGITIQNFSCISYKPHTGCQYNERKLLIIDGKQRFSTLISFYKGEFSLLVDDVEVYFNELDEDAQRVIAFFEPCFDMAFEYEDRKISDDNKIMWFEMINFAGTPQDVEHLKKLKS